MASKRRLRRREQQRGCGNKHRFIEEWQARQFMRSLERDKGETNLNVYKCVFCGRYHVGHARRS